MNYNSNSILRYINRPAKIIFWDIEDAFAFLMPFALFVLIGKFMFGVIFGILGFKAFKLARKSFGCIAHAIYWYLPTGKVYKIYIPSHIREYVG